MTSSNLHRVFVYGTLQRGQPNYGLVANTSNGVSNYAGKGQTTSRYPLVIASEYNIPFLLQQEGTGKIISGEIYDVDDRMLTFLDHLEAHPDLYERSKTNILMTHDSNDQPLEAAVPVECWCYFFPIFKSGMLNLPFLDSYDSYGEHGLPYLTKADRDRVVTVHDFWADVKETA